MAFPLYSALKDQISDEDLTDIQKQFLIDSFPKLDLEQKENVYALIKCSANSLKEPPVSAIIPYNGRMVGNRMKFNLDDFSFILKQILYKYIHSELTTLSPEESPEIVSMISAAVKGISKEIPPE